MQIDFTEKDNYINIKLSGVLGEKFNLYEYLSNKYKEDIKLFIELHGIFKSENSFKKVEYKAYYVFHIFGRYRTLSPSEHKESIYYETTNDNGAPYKYHSGKVVDKVILL